MYSMICFAVLMCLCKGSMIKDLSPNDVTFYVQTYSDFNFTHQGLPCSRYIGNGTHAYNCVDKSNLCWKCTPKSRFFIISVDGDSPYANIYLKNPSKHSLMAYTFDTG